MSSKKRNIEKISPYEKNIGSVSKNSPIKLNNLENPRLVINFQNNQSQNDDDCQNNFKVKLEEDVINNIQGSKKVKIAREIVLTSNNQHAITNANYMDIDLEDTEESKLLSDASKKGYQAIYIVEEQNALEVFLTKSKSIYSFRWSDTCTKPAIGIIFVCETLILYMHGFSKVINSNYSQIKEHFMVTAHQGMEENHQIIEGAELKLWDLKKLKLLQSYPIKGYEVESLVIVHDSFVVVAYSNREIHVLDIQSNKFEHKSSQKLQLNEGSKFKNLHVFLPDEDENRVKIIVLTTDGVFYLYRLIYDKRLNKKEFVVFEFLSLNKQKDWMINISNIASSINYPNSIFYCLDNKLIQANIWTMKIENTNIPLDCNEIDHIQYILLIDSKNLKKEATHILCFHQLDSTMSHVRIENDKFFPEYRRIRINWNAIGPKVQLAKINKGIDYQEMKLFCLLQQNDGDNDDNENYNDGDHDSQSLIKIINLRLFD